MNRNKSYKVQSILQVVISLVILVLVNFIAGYRFMRIDLTEDQRYSLKQSTIDLLEDDERIEQRIDIKVYLTGDLPAEWERLQKEIEIKLEEYHAYAGNKLRYTFEDISEDPATADDVRKQKMEQGLKPVRIGKLDAEKQESRIIFPGALIYYGGSSKPVPVNFLESSYSLMNVPREQLTAMIQSSILELEYNLTSGIVRATTEKTPTIGFLEGHGELEEIRLKSIMNSLEKENSYATTRVALTAKDSTGRERENIHALDNIDLLVIAKPTKPFSDRHKYIIDQYIMDGGKSMWLVDGLADYRDSLKYYGYTRGIDHRPNLKLRDQLFRYGVRIENNLVLDAQCAPNDVPVQGSDGEVKPRIVPWYFYPLASNKSDSHHSITNNIAPVKLEYASSVSLVNQENPDIKHTPLLFSSSNSYYRRAPVDIFYKILSQPQKWEDPNWPKDDDSKRLPLAVLIEGEFTSAFKNRLAPESEKKLQPKAKSVPTKMIVVGDGDIIKNDVYSDPLNQSALKPVPIDRSVYGEAFPQMRQMHYGNKLFMMNAVDYLLGDATLIDARSKHVNRNLDQEKVAEEKSKWQFLTTTVPVLIIALFGIGYMIIRRYRFAK